MVSFQIITPQEIPLLQQLASKIWHDNYSNMISLDQIQYMLDFMYNTSLLNNEINNKNFVWNFICWNGDVVGYFCCKREDKKLFLSKLYLDIAAQGNGIAQQTMLHIKQIAQKEHFSHIYLTVNKTNQKGIKAYEKFGFKNIQSLTTDIGNGFVMDDFVYEYEV